MNREELEKYKKSLETLEQRLKEELKEIPERIDFGDQVDPEEDEADEAVAANEQTGIREAIRARIEDVRSSLNKIRNGNYGTCEECGVFIETEILKIVPESRLCRTHKLKN